MIHTVWEEITAPITVWEEILPTTVKLTKGDVVISRSKFNEIYTLNNTNFEERLVQKIIANVGITKVWLGGINTDLELRLKVTDVSGNNYYNTHVGNGAFNKEVVIPATALFDILTLTVYAKGFGKLSGINIYTSYPDSGGWQEIIAPHTVWQGVAI